MWLSRLSFIKILPGSKEKERIQSMDLFRGFAVVTMMMVNYLGQFRCMPWAFKHHPWGLSFADTVAPYFLFAVGMGYRLGFLHTVKKGGIWRARRAALRRYLILIIIGIVIYGIDFDVRDPMDALRDLIQRDMWDALVDIGFAGILALPFMQLGTIALVGAAMGYCSFYQALYSYTGYGEWTMARSIDGGPLGPLSWVVPLLLGAVAFDWLKRDKPGRTATKSIMTGILLIGLGWWLSRFWGFSQKGMTASYAIISTGICFVVFASFHVYDWTREWKGARLTVILGGVGVMGLGWWLYVPWGAPPGEMTMSGSVISTGISCIVLTTFCLVANAAKIKVLDLVPFGKNPLLLYIFHFLLIFTVGEWVPKDSPVIVAIASFGALYVICYLVASTLARKNYYLRI